MFTHTSSLIFFVILILGLLVLDLKWVQPTRKPLLRILFWVSLAMLFNIGIYFTLGAEPALNFLTGYILEESLSMDNLFVFLLVFTYFKVPEKYVQYVLFWGILGALVMRALFIAGGIALIHQVHGVLYLFGAFLIFAGFKIAFGKDTEFNPENNFLLRIVRRFIPVTEDYEGKQFFIKKAGQWFATPLFLVLIVIETTDILFAMDSIPAILAITDDPFIVYTSNVFAILGLKTLYFVIQRSMKIFHYLHYGLAFILVFVGAKMLLGDFFVVPVIAALGVILLTITVSILASLYLPKPRPKKKK